MFNKQKQIILYIILSIVCFIVFSLGICQYFGIIRLISDEVYTYISQDIKGQVAGATKTSAQIFNKNRNEFLEESIRVCSDDRYSETDLLYYLSGWLEQGACPQKVDNIIDLRTNSSRLGRPWYIGTGDHFLGHSNAQILSLYGTDI